MCRDGQSRLNFSNEAQFLLISEESVSDLNNRISSSMFSYHIQFCMS
jgi:molybdenum cofactor sulfurtransferase